MKAETEKTPFPLRVVQLLSQNVPAETQLCRLKSPDKLLACVKLTKLNVCLSLKDQFRSFLPWKAEPLNLSPNEPESNH